MAAWATTGRKPAHPPLNRDQGLSEVLSARRVKDVAERRCRRVERSDQDCVAGRVDRRMVCDHRRQETETDAAGAIVDDPGAPVLRPDGIVVIAIGIGVGRVAFLGVVHDVLKDLAEGRGHRPAEQNDQS